MSSHDLNEARVIPLRPATAAAATAATAPPAVPARDRTVVQPPSGLRAAKEPLWRHVVGDVLRRERLAQERTLKDVADEARISMPYLSELERGRKEASSEVLAAAARALGLGLADLLALTQGELARLASARTAEGRAELTPVTSTLHPHAGRAAGSGDDNAAVTSVAEVRRQHAGARPALRRTELCLAA